MSDSPTGPVKTLADLWDDYERDRALAMLDDDSWSRYRNDFRAVRRALVGHLGREPLAADIDVQPPGPGGRPVPQPGVDNLKAAFARYQAEPIRGGKTRAKSTVRGALSTWDTFCGWAQRSGRLAGNPVTNIEDKPTVHKGVPKPLEGGQESIDALMTATALGARYAAAAEPGRRGRLPGGGHPFPLRDLAVIATLAGTGVRRGEACALNVADYDPNEEAPMVRVRAGKGDKARWQPASPELVLVLDGYLQQRWKRWPVPSGQRAELPLLVDDRGDRMEGHQLYYLVERCIIAAGLRSKLQPGALVHALRHWFGTNLAQSGAHIRVIQNLLGHASITSTAIYTAVSEQQARDAVTSGGAAASLRALGYAPRPVEGAPDAHPEAS